jgi:hypothetical protein
VLAARGQFVDGLVEVVDLEVETRSRRRRRAIGSHVAPASAEGSGATGAIEFHATQARRRSSPAPAARSSFRARKRASPSSDVRRSRRTRGGARPAGQLAPACACGCGRPRSAGHVLVGRPQQARRGPGRGRSHGRMRARERGGVSSPGPVDTPVGPAPCFWRGAGSAARSGRHPLSQFDATLDPRRRRGFVRSGGEVSSGLDGRRLAPHREG